MEARPTEKITRREETMNRKKPSDKKRSDSARVQRVVGPKPKRGKAPPYRDFWDTNAHSILMLQSLLKDATTPGEKFALKRVLRIMFAISDEVNPETLGNSSKVESCLEAVLTYGMKAQASGVDLQTAMRNIGAVHKASNDFALTHAEGDASNT